MYKFAVILSGVAEITPELSNSLFETTGGDIEFQMCNGVAYLEFERKAISLREAILSAIDQVEGAKPSVRVVRVESNDANTIAKINAELLGLAEKS